MKDEAVCPLGKDVIAKVTLCTVSVLASLLEGVAPTVDGHPRFQGSYRGETTYSFACPRQYVGFAKTRRDMGGTAFGRRAARRAGSGSQAEMKKGRNSPFVLISIRP